MADPRRRLEVVAGEGGRREAPDADSAAGRLPAPRGWLTWALAALLVLSLVGLALESRRAAELSGRVERVAAELTATRAALRAHQSHLDQVRASVAELQILLERDPAAPPPDPR